MHLFIIHLVMGTKGFYSLLNQSIFGKGMPWIL